MTKRSAALHQVTQAFLDHALGLGIQVRRGFIQDQNPRIGQDCARDGNALALAAGKLHAALADDGFVLFFEAFGEFVDTRDPASFQNLLLGGMRPGESDVLPNGSVEQKRFLQHHAELRAIGVQADGGKIHAVHQDGSRFRCRETQRSSR